MQPDKSTSNESMPSSVKPVYIPNKIVAVGAGIELYHLNDERQLSYFTVYSKDSEKWLTYALPKLPDRESCPQAGAPLVMPNGTIYITAAGGIINRLTPQDDGHYKHSYMVIGEMDAFAVNPTPAKLIAEGDEPIASPQIIECSVEEKEGVKTVQERKVSFFKSYYDCKSSMVDQPPFNMLVKQGLQTQKEHETLWDKERPGLPSLKQGMKTLSGLPEDQKTESDLYKVMASKDGPAKEEKKVIWSKETQKLQTKAEIMAAVQKMRPTLEQEWGPLLQEGKNGKCKFKPETMPYQKVRMATIPGEANTVVVCMSGQLFKLEDSTASLTPLGVMAPSAQRAADCTGIVALDANTFVIGDMGLTGEANGPKTLRVVKSSGDVDMTATNTLLSALAPLWNNNQTPRVKSMTMSVSDQGVISLYIRTKHTGNDVVRVDVTYHNGTLEVLNTYPLPVSDTLNNEHLAVYKDQLLCGMETEDYMCQFNLFSRAHIKALEHAHINCYVATPDATDSASQKPTPVGGLPHLPAFIPYTGYGLSGIATV